MMRPRHYAAWNLAGPFFRKYSGHIDLPIMFREHSGKVPGLAFAQTEVMKS
jgi:hypothetical protein